MTKPQELLLEDEINFLGQKLDDAVNSAQLPLTFKRLLIEKWANAYLMAIANELERQKKVYEETAENSEETKGVIMEDNEPNK